MSRSCIIQEFPIPEREYYAAAPVQWDEPRSRRPAPSRLKKQRRKRRSSGLLPLALAGLALFVCGFLLGRVQAAGAEPSPPKALSSQQSFPLMSYAKNRSERKIVF